MKNIDLKKLAPAMLYSCLVSFSAHAQNCQPAPSCESMGFNKTTADCNGIDSIKCPLDETKLYCNNSTSSGSSGDDDGTIAIGRIAYSDGTISSVLKSGKTPIGVIVNVSGLAINLENLEMSNAETRCSNYSIAGLNNWKAFTLEQVFSLKTNSTTIDDTLKKINAAILPNKIYYDTGSSNYEVGTFSGGLATRCVIDINDMHTTPETTYQVGDTLKINGVVVGTIIEVINDGSNGTIAVERTANTYMKAVKDCLELSAGGLSWSLASASHIYKILSTKRFYLGEYNFVWDINGKCVNNSGIYDVGCSSLDTSYSMCNSMITTTSNCSNDVIQGHTQAYYCVATF